MASSKKSTENNIPPAGTEIPLSALHTAAAALSLVPESHWDVETHRFNIASYDGSGIVMTSEGDGDKARIAADKAFKKELYHYLRWALSAGAPGPGIPETMEILGRPETVRRLQEAKEISASAIIPDTTTPDAAGSDDRSWMGSLR